MPSHSGFTDTVNLTISLCLTYVLCISCVRMWIRKGAFGVDDIVTGLATLVSFGHTAADYVALANGLGKPWTGIISDGSISSLNAASIAGIVTWIIALYSSKCAMICFLSRITKTHSQLVLYHMSNAITATLGIASLLTVIVDCAKPSVYYWAFHANVASCSRQNLRWQILTALDVASEVLLLALPIHLVYGLQMRLRKKIIIISAFYLRLPAIGLSLGRNYYTLRLHDPDTDIGLESGLVVIWLEIQLAYALAAGTLSGSKAFTESFNSSFGLGFARGKGDDSYGLSGLSGKTPVTSKAEKSRIDSALESGASESRTRSMPTVLIPKRHLNFLDPMVTPIPTDSHASLDMTLRPDVETGNSYSHVTADHGPEPWREHSSASDTSGQDMFILQETAYQIQHDQAPLVRSGGYYGEAK